MKQVIVVNEALQLPTGKRAAQVAHAAVAAFLEADEQTRQMWLDQGMPKVVLQSNNEKELIELEALARAQNLPARLIKDAGKTVLPAGTVTCLGLGPAGDSELDALTGGLKQLS
jgi:peptidyl-tRNA hydrolase